MKHVPALDGLRGIAVAAVVIFHLRLNAGGTRLLPGGYLGVDVFFCLSGYLITSLLIAERRRSGTISLRSFWLRRAKRLLPALFAMVLAVVAVVAVDARTAEILGSQRGPALATLLYVANWREIVASVSYFGRFVTPPLGHTWSLAIEEQFYLVWPIVGLLALRRSNRRLGVVAVIGAVASGMWFVLATNLFGLNRAYYGTDTRLCAILSGAALAVWCARPAGHHRGSSAGFSPRTLRWLEPLGALAIAGLITGFALADGTSSFIRHGGLVLVAVLSCGAILAAVHSEGPIGRALGLRPLVVLGMLSYSIYLWHIPVIAVLSPQRTGWTGPSLTFLRLGAIGVLSAASYRLLEQPVRRTGIAPRRLVPAFGAASVCCVVVAAAIAPSITPTLARAGADGYDPNATAQPSSGKIAIPSTAPSTSVDVPASKLSDVLVVGDSVAWSLEAQLRRSPIPGVGVVDRGVVGCNIWKGEPVIIDQKRTSDPAACAQWPDRWRGLLAVRQPQVAVLTLGTSGNERVIDGVPSDECSSAFRAAFAAHAVEAIDVLSSTGAMVLVTTVPDLGVDFRPNAREHVDCVNEELRAAVASRAEVSELVDLAELVCPGRVCIQQRGGVVVRPDGIHFNPKGDPWVGRWLLEQALESDRLARHHLVR